MGHKLGFALAINKKGEALNARLRPSLSHTKFSSSSFDSASEGSGVPAEREGRTEKLRVRNGTGGYNPPLLLAPPRTCAAARVAHANGAAQEAGGLAEMA